MEGYKCNIEFCSKELTAKERIAIKDTTNAVRLDEATENATPNAPLVITPRYYAVLDIENVQSESGKYKNYIVVDDSGLKYVTGSEAFYTSLRDIMEEMKDETEPYSIAIYRRESKNYKGKTFITCSII